MKTDTLPTNAKSCGPSATKKLRPDAPAFVPIQRILENLLLYHQVTNFPLDKEPQCSRYSRKSVRISLDSLTAPATPEKNKSSDSASASTAAVNPRPILGGGKNVSPRAILGRKENILEDKTSSSSSASPTSSAAADRTTVQMVNSTNTITEEIEDEDDEDGLASMGKEYRLVYRRIQKLKLSDEGLNQYHHLLAGDEGCNSNLAIVAKKSKFFGVNGKSTF